jgi:hypothetical protein
MSSTATAPTPPAPRPGSLLQLALIPKRVVLDGFVATNEIGIVGFPVSKIWLSGVANNPVVLVRT